MASIWDVMRQPNAPTGAGLDAMLEEAAASLARTAPTGWTPQVRPAEASPMETGSFMGPPRMQAQPASDQFAPSIMGRVRNALLGASGETPTNLDEQGRIRNATYDALIQKGVSPEMAKAATLNPDLMKGMITQHFGGNKYGLNPIWTEDEQGNAVAFQPSERGGVKQLQFPTCIRPTPPGLKTVDDGTGTTLVTRGGTAQGRVAKDIRGREAEEKIGAAQGQAQADWPRVEANAKRMLDQVDAVVNDPNLAKVTGWEGNLWTIQPGSHDTEERIRQLNGSAFLQAFESLRGGGAITEVEGDKATKAIARLQNFKQSDKGFKQALADLRDVINKGMEVARRRAGGVGAATPGAGSVRIIGVR